MTPHEAIMELGTRMGRSIVGQTEVIERLVIGLLANGNLLVEGLPGLAKTRAIKAMANNLEADFSRIQFTPDLLPSDVTGSEVYHQAADAGTFKFDPGPIFANIVLADEINRAPAKVQAALLEAMEERTVTVAGTTHALPELFMVMATQNPVEQEGTYPLPEAQMDRFLLHVKIGYPSVEDEVEVIRLVRGETAGTAPDAPVPLSQDVVMAARREIDAIQVAPAMDRYIADLVQATRTPDMYDGDLASWIDIGVSPRGSLALDRCGRAHAWLNGRDYLDPQDVQAIVPDAFRHRLTLSFEAEGSGIDADAVTAEVLRLVALP